MRSKSPLEIEASPVISISFMVCYLYNRHCTGIGARALFGDEELIPVKGQYTILKPQPEVDYIASAIPREDGILLGGIAQFGEWSLEPDRDAERRYMERHRAFFEAMELRQSEAHARARQA